MRQLDFPADVRTQIARDRYHHPDPLVQRRMEVLWLKSLGQPHALIAQAAGVSRATVQRVLRAYDSGGLEAARTFHWKTPVSALTPHQAVLEEEFTARPPHTVGEACERIEKEILSNVVDGAEVQAASFTPSLNTVPAITSGSNTLPLSFRQLFWALSINLKAMADRLPEPLGLVRP